MPETITQAVAQRDNSPAALIRKYSTDFATVLPTHVKADTWVRLAQGALRKGKRIEDRQDPNFGRFELEVAASNNPGAFMAALLDAARQGLEPGTEQYYLTPRKVKGKLEILGITGYQGYVELMYRSGAVASVQVEVVRANDQFRYRRGIDRVPVHEFPSFALEAERGQLVGVYSYAEMKDGAISQVVRLNREQIARIRAVNPASNSQYSPWTNWEEAMWMKSAARQLRKWVPTSAEFRMEIARATAEVQRLTAAPHMPPGTDTPQGDVLEGEVVGDPEGAGWPDVAEIPDGDPGARQ